MTAICEKCHEFEAAGRCLHCISAHKMWGWLLKRCSAVGAGWTSQSRASVHQLLSSCLLRRREVAVLRPPREEKIAWACEMLKVRMVWVRSTEPRPLAVSAVLAATVMNRSPGGIRCCSSHTTI